MCSEKVSVIVPIYQIEDYITRCVESIISQSYTNLQIILVDDGSTDSCPIICDEFAKRDERITVIHKENGGLVTARKAGISRATGYYTIFVDGDDYIERNFCANLVDIIKRTQVDFVHGGYVQLDKNEKLVVAPQRDEIINRLTENEKIDFLKNRIFDTTSDNRITASIWSKIYKTELIKKCYSKIPDTQSMGEDLITLCCLVFECDSFAISTICGYQYVISDSSMTRSINLSMMADLGGLQHCLRQIAVENGALPKLEESIQKYTEYWMQKVVDMYVNDHYTVDKYIFPENIDLSGKKVVLYGAGVVGKCFINQLLRSCACDVVAWVDKKFEMSDYRLLLPPAAIPQMDFDVLILCVLKESISKEITSNLVELGISEEKILWINPKSFLS